MKHLTNFSACLSCCRRNAQIQLSQCRLRSSDVGTNVTYQFTQPPLRHRRYVSRMFQNLGQVQPKDLPLMTCISQKLLLYNDIIASCYPGAFHLLPLGVRALDKLVRLIDREMDAIGGQKLSMPSLSPRHLWEKTGRWQAAGPELFTVKDRHSHEFCLSPTHEEIVTELFANVPISYKNLPVMLYQIGRKFRDEMAPKYGLLRGREFEMKDMYTFDADEKSAKETYEKVCDAYTRIFNLLQVHYIKVSGSTGMIGGSMSHEYHYPADVGEDRLAICDRCGYGANAELLDNAVDLKANCPRRDPNCEVRSSPGIEVGHAFFLGTKYSEPLNAVYTDDKKVSRPSYMGCFGLGVTRILQATVEVLSTPKALRWPQLLAPYQICIVPQKEGYRSEDMFEMAEGLSDSLTALPNLKGEVVIDDRTHLTVGRRVYEANRIGYPYVIVVGKRAVEKPSLFEVVDVAKETTQFLSEQQVLDMMQRVETL